MTDKENKDKENEEVEEVIEAEIVEEDGKVSETNDDIESKINNNAFEQKYYRLLADFTNFKAREEKNKNDFRKFAISNLIEKLLPVLDNLDRALANQNTDDSLIKGIMMVRADLFKTLSNEGLKEIKSDNEKFDPKFHQAVMTEEVEGMDSDIIIETYQKGYMLNDKVIRVSMVKVTK